jgi:hypothetical protein
MVYRWLLKRGPQPDCVLAGIEEPVAGTSQASTRIFEPLAD